MPTLEAFNLAQNQKVKSFLASQVAAMMGRKFEEEDWAKVYRAGKGILGGGWSNPSIDIVHGALGVEQKMIRYNDKKALREACGTALMHPAGTRAIRIPPEPNPTLAARNILRQYAELIEERTSIVRIVHQYHHNVLSRVDAIAELCRHARMKPEGADKFLPRQLLPVGQAEDAIDMRNGWLLWQSDLREFLYFEEAMTVPIADDYVAEWHESGGGRRRKSRTLWVYHKAEGDKRYSITTDAGAKIQPYFKVPPATDANLCHWIVQGERAETGHVRVWLTRQTADLLKARIGSIETSVLSSAILGANLSTLGGGIADSAFGPLAVDILIDPKAYTALNTSCSAVSDEHRFRMLAELFGG